MIFYIALDDAGHRQLCGTQADAKAINKNFEQIDIPTDKPGLMAFVQGLYDEANFVEPVDDEVGCALFKEPVTSPISAEVFDPPPAAKPSYVDQSVNWDALFPTLPLAHQLHFAAMAMENARERL
jgi:hypothetical protein